jgi:hypothetical protein
MVFNSSECLILEEDGKKRICQSANACLFVETESWNSAEWVYGPAHSRASLDIEVDVDEDSGADGAAAPRLQMFFDPLSPRLHSIEGIANTKWHHGYGCEIEAFYGNDAPPIGNCTIIFGDWISPSVIQMEWHGSMRWKPNDPELSFRLKGPIHFNDVSIRVKRAEDVAPIFSVALPGFDLERLGMAEVNPENFGDAMPANRRIWETHKWSLGGRLT